MRVNYDILMLILKDMKTLDHVTIKTLNDINGNNKKLLIYNDNTFETGHPVIEYSCILFSDVSIRLLNYLKLQLLENGFTERTGGEA